MSIPITTVPSSPWPARRVAWPRSFSRARARRWRASTSIATRACTRTSGRWTSRPSCSATALSGARPAPRRWCSATCSARSWACRSSSTARSAVGAPARTCAAAGPAELARRMAAGELRPDFGPSAPHPSAGAALVAARPPLVAFNVELAAGHGVEEARAIAARIREGGEEGLPGVRAIGLELAARGGVAQVSVNVEDPGRSPWRPSSRRSRATPRSRRPSSSAWRRARPSPGSRRTCRSATGRPSRTRCMP